MLCCVDPPVPSTGHAVMSPDLQAALGTIQRGTKEWLEILKDRKKRQLEIGEVETKSGAGRDTLSWTKVVDLRKKRQKQGSLTMEQKARSHASGGPLSQ